MSFIPRKRKRLRMGTRTESRVVCPSHLSWGRKTLECALAGKGNHVCGGRMEAHHLQSYRAIEGGMGRKVGDDKVIFVCTVAHAEYHDKGQSAIDRTYGVNSEDIGAGTWKASPHRRKYELERGVTGETSPAPNT